ncbi:MAG: ATP-binding protein [Pseudomonadota bacterium]
MSDLSMLWASLPAPTLVVDGQDRLLDINPAAEGFFNISLKSVRGQPVWDKIMVNAPLEAAFQRARENGSVLYVNDVDVGSGERAPLQCNLQIAPMQGSPDHMLMLISPRELSARIEMGSDTRSAARSAIGMAEMLAHEIKNPLAGINGAAQLLSMNLSQEDLEMTDLIVAETRRIVKLLDQVEMFGNLRPPERKPVNVHDVLDRARKSAMVGVGAHMHFIETYDPSLPPTYGDPDQLLQVLMNLIKNASEAADKDGGKIWLKTYYDMSLRVRKKDGSGAPVPLQIEVIDDGPGLPPEIADQVFDPFISGKENGTGLGLALVSKIIEDHDGYLRVDSVPGKTVFRLSLPLVPKAILDRQEP